jgi:sugar phosphate isomerase/epimerase
VLFNGGKRAFEVPPDESWQRAVSFMQEAAEYAQRAGVYITLEAEPYVYFLVHDLGTTLRMVKAVDHPHFLAAIDIGHMNLSREAPATIEDLKLWIARIHLSENDGLLHANAILGTGSVTFGPYLRTLKDSGIDKLLATNGMELIAVMELGVLGDEIEDPDAYAIRSMEHIRAVAPFMEL